MPRKVTQWHYWEGNGLAIYRPQVRVTTASWPWVSYLHLCGSVTKQYNLVLAKGVITLDGKVTTCLVESIGSLPPGL